MRRRGADLKHAALVVFEYVVLAADPLQKDIPEQVILRHTMPNPTYPINCAESLRILDTVSICQQEEEARIRTQQYWKM